MDWIGLVASVAVLAVGLSLKSTRCEATQFVVETVEAAGDAGAYSSIALDSTGAPHISYFKGGALGNLKYAYRSGGLWVRETADDSPHVVGVYTSLALDGQDNAHVCYFDMTSYDFKYALKAGGLWTVDVVDATPTNDVVGSGPSIAVDVLSEPHIVYQSAFDFGQGAELRYAHKSGGMWAVEVLADTTVHAGAPSVALDINGAPNVTYETGPLPTTIRLASRTGGSWTHTTIDSVSYEPPNRTVLLFDAQGNPHVVYRTSPGLRYVSKSGGQWTAEFVDIGQAWAHPWHFSATLDSQGNPHIAWVDYRSNQWDLMYSRKVGGAWTTEAAHASPNVVGWYNSIQLNALGQPQISEYDASDSNLVFVAEDPRTAVPTYGSSGLELGITVMPNPAVGGLTRFLLPSGNWGNARLTIFDSAGRRMRDLELRRDIDGSGIAAWDGRDRGGRAVGDGVYLVRLMVSGRPAASGKIVVIR
jgi:hypothetical protein